MPTIFPFSLIDAAFHFVCKLSVFTKIPVSQHSINSNRVDLSQVTSVLIYKKSFSWNRLNIFIYHFCQYFSSLSFFPLLCPTFWLMLNKVFPSDSFFHLSGYTIRYSGEILKAQEGKYKLVSDHSNNTWHFLAYFRPHMSFGDTGSDPAPPPPCDVTVFI